MTENTKTIGVVLRLQCHRDEGLVSSIDLPEVSMMETE